MTFKNMHKSKPHTILPLYFLIINSKHKLKLDLKTKFECNTQNKFCNKLELMSAN